MRTLGRTFALSLCLALKKSYRMLNSSRKVSAYSLDYVCVGVCECLCVCVCVCRFSCVWGWVGVCMCGCVSGCVWVMNWGSTVWVDEGVFSPFFRLSGWAK